MQGFEVLARILVFLGLFLVLLGLLIGGAGRIPWLKFLGRLPGDIHIHGKHVQIYLPLVTSLLLSLILTLLLNLFVWLRSR